MAVIISRTDTGYKVNGKPVYKDTQGYWIAKIELTSTEEKEFYSHLNSL